MNGMNKEQSELLLDCIIDFLPPTTNHLTKPIVNKRTHKIGYHTDAKVAQQKEIITATMRSFYRKYGHYNPYTDYAEFQLILHCTNLGRWDIDNRVKAIQDCLRKDMAGVIEDDCKIWKLNVERVITGKDEDFCRVLVWKHTPKFDKTFTDEINRLTVQADMGMLKDAADKAKLKRLNALYEKIEGVRY